MIPSGDIIRSLTYGETYKYLGVMENYNNDHGLVQEKVASEYKCRLKLILSSQLCGNYKFRVIPLPFLFLDIRLQLCSGQFILLEPWTNKLENCLLCSGDYTLNLMLTVCICQVNWVVVGFCLVKILCMKSTAACFTLFSKAVMN